MDSERAERHLRLAAEGALRRARALPWDGGQVRPREIFTECIARLRGVASTLVTVGAVDAGQADMIMDEFQAALGVRHLHPITASPLFMPRPGPPGAPAGVPVPAVPSGPLRVISVSRMLPIRDEELTGELYVMSLVVTAAQAVAPAVARIRTVPHEGGLVRAALVFPPRDTITATDDRGTLYHTGWHGHGTPGRWAGDLQIRPAPPPDAQWLELSSAGQASLRIALTGARQTASLTAEPRPSAPGEQLLADVAQQILAAAADGTGMARQTAANLGDTIAALEAAGALSPLSPTPGQLGPGDRHVCRPVWATRSRPPGAKNWNGPGHSGWASCSCSPWDPRSRCCCPGWSRPAGPAAAPAPPSGGRTAPPWRPR